MKPTSAQGQRCTKLWLWKLQGAAWLSFAQGAQHMASGSSGDDKLPGWAWGGGVAWSLHCSLSHFLPGEQVT